MLGKGLSSLIPKKESNQEPVTDNQPGDSPFRRGEALGARLGLVSERSGEPAERERRSASAAGAEERPVLSGGKAKRPPESIFQIEVEKIKPNPYQPRREFNQEALRELADSIRAHGIIQPLVVSKVEKETETGTEVEYQLIAGERRLLAAKLIGLERVPAIIKKVDSHHAKLELALIENIQRSNLNPIESARAYARLSEEFNLTQQEIGSRVGKSRESVANTMRLLKLSPHIQEALGRGEVNESQARTLLAIENPQEQERSFQALLADHLSVRELKNQSVRPKVSDPQQVYWERQLEEKLGAPVRVIKHGPKGKVVIRFNSEEEWQVFLSRFIGESE